MALAPSASLALGYRAPKSFAPSRRVASSKVSEAVLVTTIALKSGTIKTLLWKLFMKTMISSLFDFIFIFIHRIRLFFLLVPPPKYFVSSSAYLPTPFFPLIFLTTTPGLPPLIAVCLAHEDTWASRLTHNSHKFGNLVFFHTQKHRQPSIINPLPSPPRSCP